MLILSFNALTSPALLKAVRIQVRPWTVSYTHLAHSQRAVRLRYGIGPHTV